MSDKPVDKRLADLSDRMRREWDERVQHDYRFWMSDGVADDAAMWQTGVRDFNILSRGIDVVKAKSQVALEVGCGVGRLVRAAADVFGRVIGVDVSGDGLNRARDFLRGVPNVEFVQSNGFDVQPLPERSVDFAYSFAALSSMPIAVAASYICDLARVLKPGGIARLQIYLGYEQGTCEIDSIAIRSFERERFESAVSAAGFRVEWIEELKLPFDISDPAAGLVAHIAALVRESSVPRSAADVSLLLAQSEERPEGRPGEREWVGSRTAYLMAVYRAQQHLEAGRAEEARKALVFAIENYTDAEEDVKAHLRDLQQLCGIPSTGKSVAASGDAATSAAHVATPLGDGFSSELYEKNLRALRDRFPAVAALLDGVTQLPDLAVERGSSGLPVLRFRGNSLDHRDKPDRSGGAWAERAMNAPNMQQAKNVIVAGFAGGYHLRALGQLCDKNIHVVELEPQILKAALAAQDCTDVIRTLASIHLSVTEFEAAQQRDPEFGSAITLVHPQTHVLWRDQVEKLRKIVASKQGFRDLRPSIAVIGPLYGGSQPIGAYTARALQELGQRVQYYDLACFHNSYSKFGAFIRESARIDVLQSYYVEMMSQLILEGISERPVDIVICLAQAPLSPRVLTQMRERGIITAMWFVEDCSRFNTWESIARYYDYMFLIQRDGYPERVQAAGAGSAIYLPTGCDPLVHCPLGLTEEERQRWGSDISFVGAGYNNRQQVFATLAQRDFKIWGTEWPQMMPFTRLVQEKGRRVDPAEYVKIFNASAINLNLHSSMERDGVEPNGDFVNPRTFELAAAGAFQLVDERTLLPEKFEIGREMITFSNRVELEQKIDYYLAHPEERKAIADRSRQRALAEHTYVHRVQEMLSHIYSERYDQLKSRLQRGPWQETLRAAEPYPELTSRFKRVFERGDEPKLDSLVGDIQLGKGSLTETEQKLLFLHHVKKQIVYINELRAGKST